MRDAIKRLAVIGSTGSIGTNTLDVIRAQGKRFKVHSLAVCRNIALLEKQIREFRPEIVSVWDEPAAAILKKRQKRLGVRVLSGHEGLLALVHDARVDVFAFGLSGSTSILPLLEALKSGRRVTIANKEPLVMAGDLVRSYVRRYKSEIIPVDSEHSAIFQSLQGHKTEEIEKIILTASGGPFFKLPENKFGSITPGMALKHPKWKMGRKITVDSATMMNKALEIIEAATLFGVSHDKVEVLIHPEAIIHSMVQFVDGSVIAQLGVTDMRLPIQYALGYPDRLENGFGRVAFDEIRAFHFYKPDFKRFPTLQYGFQAAKAGGTLPTVLNAADEVCVEQFLAGKISFLDIMVILGKTMKAHRVKKSPAYDDIMQADSWARQHAGALCALRMRKFK